MEQRYGIGDQFLNVLEHGFFRVAVAIPEVVVADPLENGKRHREMIEALELKAGESVVEIGPGLGALTDKILEYPVTLRVFEKDKKLAEILRLRYRDKEIRQAPAEWGGVEAMDFLETCF